MSGCNDFIQITERKPGQFYPNLDTDETALRYLSFLHGKDYVDELELESLVERLEFFGIMLEIQKLLFTAEA